MSGDFVKENFEIICKISCHLVMKTIYYMISKELLKNKF